MQLIGNAAADVLGNTRSTAAEMRAVRHVEVGFIQRQRLDQVCVISKNRVNFLRRFTVSIHARLDDGQVGTQL
ncbi:hypothetical protein SRM1_01211 [Pseudomonas fluorescens]|nr:hypothetical protein SRM1_01211 [Pseudomonas fluorescens]